MNTEILEDPHVCANTEDWVTDVATHKRMQIRRCRCRQRRRNCNEMVGLNKATFGLVVVIVLLDAVAGYSTTSLSPRTRTPLRAIAIPPTGQTPANLDSKDLWIANLDYDGFGKEVTALGKEIQAQGGQADVDHLNKILDWRNAAALIGLATVWATPNPLTVLALSTWTYASWTMVAHHTCHGGYNRVDAGKYNSRGFALGPMRRAFDWLDWMIPEAWNVEHNRLHHYRLNEDYDPDLVQRNLAFLRDMKIPMVFKYATVAFFLPIWKWYYYAPNTFKELCIQDWKQAGKELPAELDPLETCTMVSLFGAKGPHYDALREVCPPRKFLLTVLGPFFGARLVAIPALVLAISSSPILALHALVNVVLADLVTNIHSFITIVTNHAGSDLYTFKDAVKPRTPAFYVRQITGSVNYDLGDDVTDFSHGWLNYRT